MPDQRFYTWHSPHRLRDHAYAHPGTLAISVAGALIGTLLITSAVLSLSSNEIPRWIKAWMGAAVGTGGTLSAGLLHR